MALTREQLKAQGILLRGPVVPTWFKRQSDGCSVPGPLKWLLLAKLWRARCYIHDFEYYVTAVQYHERDSGFARSRKKADDHLRDNLALCSKFVALNPVFQLFGVVRFGLSHIYWAGVRAGGRFAIETKVGRLAVPPTVKAINEIREECTRRRGAPTGRAEYIFKLWEQHRTGER